MFIYAAHPLKTTSLPCTPTTVARHWERTVFSQMSCISYIYRPSSQVPQPGEMCPTQIPVSTDSVLWKEMQGPTVQTQAFVRSNVINHKGHTGR